MNASLTVLRREPPSARSAERLDDVLLNLTLKGVRLWSVGGELRYRAPKGALTALELELMRSRRSEILVLLENSGVAEELEPRLLPRPLKDEAPLTFSQSFYWNARRPHERRISRGVTSATRLRGRLRIDLLEKSLVEVIRRHEALRTRFVVVDGTPIQKIRPPENAEVFPVEDLTSLNELVREDRVRRRIEECTTEPIDVASDPLFAARLLRLREQEHVLILSTEHLISDAVSLSILRRDLLTVYTQLIRGEQPHLSPLRMQLADYAVWQRATYNSWLERHGHYLEHFAGCQRVRFPDDVGSLPEGRSGWESVPIHLNSDVTRRLREWSKLHSTTLSMSVLTAFAALSLRWCGVSESVIQYQSDGRLSDQVSNVVGFFASVLYLRVDAPPGARLSDLTQQVTGEYTRALEHANFSHLALNQPPPGFVRNAIFNWVPREHIADIPVPENRSQPLVCEPIPLGTPGLENLEWDHEPGIQMWEYDTDIVGHLFFPRSRFGAQTMQRFGRDLLRLIDMMLETPKQVVAEIALG